jgi:DUF177 domain-containing protein
MPLLFNLRHLEERNLVLKGDLPVSDLDVDGVDELIHVRQPLSYDLEAEKHEQAALVQGALRVTLHCECARCLKGFPRPLALEHWACHIPLAGEEKAAVVNDCVDLTPYIREDILLAFPQRPLCEPECRGLAGPEQDMKAGGAPASEAALSAWAELNKLKF